MGHNLLTACLHVLVPMVGVKPLFHCYRAPKPIPACNKAEASATNVLANLDVLEGDTRDSARLHN